MSTVLFFSRQFGLAVCNSQGLYHILYIAQYKFVEIIYRKPYSVIGYPPLGEVISSYALRPVARADKTFPVLVVSRTIARRLVIV